jgi:hypothetical protein
VIDGNPHIFGGCEFVEESEVLEDNSWIWRSGRSISGGCCLVDELEFSGPVDGAVIGGDKSGENAEKQGFTDAAAAKDQCEFAGLETGGGIMQKRATAYSEAEGAEPQFDAVRKLIRGGRQCHGKKVLGWGHGGISSVAGCCRIWVD